MFISLSCLLIEVMCVNAWIDTEHMEEKTRIFPLEDSLEFRRQENVTLSLDPESPSCTWVVFHMF